MATLGNQTTGFTFTINVGAGWGDLAGGSYTMPASGGLVTAINANCGNGGTSQSCRLYVWQDNAGIPGTWLVRGTGLVPGFGGLAWYQQTSLSGNGANGLYIPGGTKIWIGCYLNAGSGQIQANSGSGGGTEIGNTADGNWSDHGPAGVGQMAAYITYTPGNGHVERSGSIATGTAAVMRTGTFNNGVFAVMRGGVWVTGA